MEEDSSLGKIALFLEGGTALSSSKTINSPEIPDEKNILLYSKRYQNISSVYFNLPLRLSEHSTIKDYSELFLELLSKKEEVIILVTGTDNLPFLASYLDLHNNSKKIIITYSQRSLSRPTCEIFRNLDLFFDNTKKLPKTNFYTIILSLKNEKLRYFPCNVLKDNSYSVSCFKVNKEVMRNRYNYLDSGSLKPRDNVEFPSCPVVVSTPLSREIVEKSTSSSFILLPGLGNSDGFTQRRLYTYCNGPSLATYSDSRKKVKNNWIRNIVKDYCIAYCSELRL